MANTKLTKRKEEGSTQQVESDSDSEAELSRIKAMEIWLMICPMCTISVMI